MFLKYILVVNFFKKVCCDKSFFKHMFNENFETYLSTRHFTIFLNYLMGYDCSFTIISFVEYIGWKWIFKHSYPLKYLTKFKSFDKKIDGTIIAVLLHGRWFKMSYVISKDWGKVNEWKIYISFTKIFF